MWGGEEEVIEGAEKEIGPVEVEESGLGLLVEEVLVIRQVVKEEKTEGIDEQAGEVELDNSSDLFTIHVMFFVREQRDLNRYLFCCIEIENLFIFLVTNLSFWLVFLDHDRCKLDHASIQTSNYGHLYLLAEQAYKQDDFYHDNLLFYHNLHKQNLS